MDYLNWLIIEDYQFFSEDSEWGAFGNVLLNFLADMGEPSIFDSF